MKNCGLWKNEYLLYGNMVKDCQYLESQDKKTLKQINNLIADIERNGYDGIGKPKPLQGDLSGWWSRRIDEKNRLVYRLIENDAVEILQCKGRNIIKLK